MSLTGPGTFFEDFVVGDLVRHSRGKTVYPHDGAGLAQLVVNTSEGHFNDHATADTDQGQSIVFGALALSIVIGLAMQDTGENATAELGLTEVRLLVPVIHGDTLYAYSRVVEKAADGRGGIVTFEHFGTNQRDELVLSCRRRVHIDSKGTSADTA